MAFVLERWSLGSSSPCVASMLVFSRFIAFNLYPLSIPLSYISNGWFYYKLAPRLYRGLVVVSQAVYQVVCGFVS